MKSVYEVISEINDEIMDKEITDFNDIESNEVIRSKMNEVEDLINEYVTKEALESISSTLESMIAFHNRIVMSCREYSGYFEAFYTSGPNAVALKRMGAHYDKITDILCTQNMAMKTIREMAISRILEFMPTSESVSGKVMQQKYPYDR